MKLRISQACILFFARFTQTADKIRRKLVEEELPAHDEHQKQAKNQPRPLLLLAFSGFTSATETKLSDLSLWIFQRQ